jgi:hypothetical protein
MDRVPASFVTTGMVCPCFGDRASYRAAKGKIPSKRSFAYLPGMEGQPG